MKFLQTVFVYVLLLTPFTAVCGVETKLFENTINDCRIKISHDAIATENTGTLVVKTFNKDVTAVKPCEVLEKDITHALDTSVSIYKTKKLKPITSVFIGRLVNYPWAVKYIKTHSGKNMEKDGLSRRPLSAEQAKTLFSNKKILHPFETAVEKHGYFIQEVQCEKILYAKNGIPVDGLCWLVLKK